MMSRISRRCFLALSGGALGVSYLARGQEAVDGGVQRVPNVRAGVWPVMYSPFTESRLVDEGAVRAMVDFYVTAGVSGVFAAALTGEGFDLCVEEAVNIARQAVRQAHGRIGVVVGANYGATLDEQAASLARVQETGVDAAVVLLSRLPSAEDVEGQLCRLAEKTPGPLGIYECPWPEDRQVSADALGRVARTGRYYFMKETSWEAQAFHAKWEAAKGTPLRVFSATLPIALDVIEQGTDGLCLTVADYCPELAESLLTAQDAGERRRILRSLQAADELVVELGYPSSGKYLLRKRGVPLTTVSRSETSGPFSDGVRARLDEFLEGFDFLRGEISA